MYDYDRRTARSETPVFDALVKNHAKVHTLLDTTIKRLHDAAAKIEDFARKTHNEDPKLFELAETSTGPAYKLFEPFRPLLSKGRAELASFEASQTKVAQEARNLYEAIQDLNKAYNLATEGRLKKDAHMVLKGTHDLAMAASGLKTIFGQLVSAYGPHI